MTLRRVAALGEDNHAVLREIGGLSDAEIEELAHESVIFGAPKPGERAP